MREFEPVIFNANVFKNVKLVMSDEEIKEEEAAGEDGQAKPKAAVVAAKTECPRLKIDFCGFRATEKPCKIEVYLHNTNLHIDRDQITGYLRMRDLAREIQSRIKDVKMQLVQ